MSIPTFIYRMLRKLANAIGLNLVVTMRRRPGGQYEPITPSATYAPWLTDDAFRNTYDIIAKYTLVDEYRCYELWQLVKEVGKLDGALIEVGVWRGGSGALIAKRAELSGIKNKVYLCDTFSGVVKAGVRDTFYGGAEHADTSREIVEALIRKLRLENTNVLVGIFPEETATLVRDSTFRFGHVDVDVYDSAKGVLDWLWPRLVVGGIVVFDDYGFERCEGIARYVDEQRGKRDRLVIHNLNGHGILIKISD